MSITNLHIGYCDKFLPSFIKFINKEFDSNDHFFLLNDEMGSIYLEEEKNVKLYKRNIFQQILFYLATIKNFNISKKIILHGLFDIRIVIILFLMPWVIKKCVWVMWGGDLYVYSSKEKNYRWAIKEFFRKKVFKKIMFFSTTVPGDYELAQRWYFMNANFIHNLMYPSHLVRKPHHLSEKKILSNHEINIQVGNSADPSNNHEEVFNFLSKVEDINFKVFVPLSYGSEPYKEFIIEKGKEILGNKFIPLTDYMDFDNYNEYLQSIDIAIFNHDRQQAMGNIIGLLSLGKKVVLKENVTSYTFLKGLSVRLFTLKDKDILSSIDLTDKENNIKIMNDYFTKDRLKLNWNKVFNE